MAVQPTNTPVLPAPREFTAADFDACRQALQNDVALAFPDWTDFNRASAGNIVLLAMCHVLDILTKYQNDQARECFITTARRRRNMIAHARGLGLQLRGVAAASADLKFTLAAVILSDVTVPAGTLVLTVGATASVTFRTLADLTIKATFTTGTVAARNSTVRVETLASDGSSDQALRGSFDGFVAGTSRVIIESVEWARVDNFFNSGPTDQHYTTLVDDEERPTFVFGNGINGQVPPAGSVLVQYDTGGGSQGNVQANTITQLGVAITDVSGAAADLSVTNVAAASGGADRETVEQARRRIPGALRALTRTVKREDFEIVALLVPGVARAMMLTTDEDPLVPDNTGDLVIIPTGDPPAVPSSDLKAQVKAKVTVDFPTMLTFAVNMVDPVFVDVDVTCDVKVKDGFSQPDVTTFITNALTALFAVQDAAGSPNPLVDFGANLPDKLLPFSRIFSTVANAAGVQRVEEDTFVPADDVALDFREFPRIGTVTVNFL